ncbi:MAG TPA: GNAT family N-acetyltransferase [Mucilaginibacter sp.]
MTTIAETPRLIIREFLPEEEETYLKHFTDEMVILYLPKRSREERIGIFRKALDHYTVNKKMGIWGIFNKADGDFIGSCLLRHFVFGTGAVELGYSMERKYWGMGIGTEMAKAMVGHGFSNANTVEIVAVTDLANTGSQNVLEKAGLKRVKNLFRDGEELAYFRLYPNGSV